jgi:hypothetical protein
LVYRKFPPLGGFAQVASRPHCLSKLKLGVIAKNVKVLIKTTLFLSKSSNGRQEVCLRPCYPVERRWTWGTGAAILFHEEDEMNEQLKEEVYEVFPVG